MRRIHDKKFLEFPLCLLAIDDEDIIGKIISYSMVAYSTKIGIAVEERVFRLREFPDDFDFENEEHNRILLAGDELKITIATITKTIKTYNELKGFVGKFITDYGQQPYCRIGKKLCFEARDQIFNESMFRILCAIQSKIGNKKSHKKMYKDEIRCRAFGCKTAKMLQNVKPSNYIHYSDKKIKRITDLLEAKELISKFTYKRRLTYYSTRLTKDELIDAFRKEKLFWEQKKLNLRDDEQSKLIEEEISALRKRKSLLKLRKVPLKVLKDGGYGTG